MSAAGCDSVMSATPCPAHIESASIGLMIASGLSRRARRHHGPAPRPVPAWGSRGVSQVEGEVVAWLRAADQCAAVGGVIDWGGRIADRSG